MTAGNDVDHLRGTKSNAAAQIRDLVEQEIVTGLHQPGDRLDEMQLARKFGTSRTPVREALRQLSAAGLLDIQPNRGCFVKKLGATELVEMFEVMAELEALCCKLAARRALPEDLAHLRSLNDACLDAERRSDPDEYYYANEKFHRHIYEISRNGFLELQATALSLKLKPYRRLQLRTRNRITVSSGEHVRILEAIEAGQQEAAATEMRQHILVQGERFSDFISQLNYYSEGRSE